MNDFPGTRVMAGHLFGGFAKALGRFDLAVRDPDPEPSFIALSETLNWCVAVDDYVRQVWAPRGKVIGYDWRRETGNPDLHDLLDAVKFARNLVHHHWADALVNDEGRRYPRTYPAVYFSWRWQVADALPPHPEDKAGHAARNRRAYEARFAGEQSDATMRDVADGLAFVGRILAPPRDK